MLIPAFGRRVHAYDAPRALLTLADSSDSPADCGGMERAQTQAQVAVDVSLCVRPGAWWARERGGVVVVMGYVEAREVGLLLLSLSSLVLAREKWGANEGLFRM